MIIHWEPLKTFLTCGGRMFDSQAKAVNFLFLYFSLPSAVGSDQCDQTSSVCGREEQVADWF